jgi:novobiocin biosynthesis protein NovU/D-mycarose 3-C-methyltransferase
MTPVVCVITACRACGSAGLAPVLALGEHPLANALKGSAAEPETRFPLSLVFCEGCGLAQIAETVAKERLFSTYVWVTGTSSTARAFAEEFARMAHGVRALAAGDLVVEVASNDGTFLRPFAARGCRVVGVDPAANIASVANAEGVPTVNAFWDAALAGRLAAEHGRAQLVLARNVIAHASDLHGVIDGIRHMLADDGIGAVEFHSALHILEDLQYDSIYHEHLCYFSVRSFDRLLKARGLCPRHVESSPISGGASIVYFSRTAGAPSRQYLDALDREARAGVTQLSAWRSFAERCEEHRRQSNAMAQTFAGRTVVGFGASARSATFLNFCGFSTREIAAVIDSSPLKRHRYTPGSSIPIVTPDEGFAMRPDLIVVLAWNFRDEIVALCRARGYHGTFMVPFPNEPQMLENPAEVRA